MDCGLLLMTQRNFGPKPWSGWTNRAVCRLAVRHILGDETKTRRQGSGHHWAAPPTSTGLSGQAPPLLPPAASLLQPPAPAALRISCIPSLRSDPFGPASEDRQLRLVRAKPEAQGRGCWAWGVCRCHREAIGRAGKVSHLSLPCPSSLLSAATLASPSGSPVRCPCPGALLPFSRFSGLPAVTAPVTLALPRRDRLLSAAPHGSC